MSYQPKTREQLAAEELEAKQWSKARRTVEFVRDTEDELNEPESFTGQRASIAICMAIEKKGDEILSRLDKIEKLIIGPSQDADSQ